MIEVILLRILIGLIVFVGILISLGVLFVNIEIGGKYKSKTKSYFIWATTVAIVTCGIKTIVDWVIDKF